VPFFTSIGFWLPPRKGVADFLQEVTSQADQQVLIPLPPHAFQHMSMKDAPGPEEYHYRFLNPYVVFSLIHTMMCDLCLLTVVNDTVCIPIWFSGKQPGVDLIWDPCGCMTTECIMQG
jgi:hypothetical protein